MNFVESQRPSAEWGSASALAGGDRNDQVPIIIRYLRLARRWKWIIIGSVAVCVLLGLVLTMLMTRKYTATATIEIARAGDKIVQVESVQRETGSGDLEFYQTQYGLLRSRALAEKIATELKLVDDPEFFDMYGVDLETDAVEVAGKRRFSAASRPERLEKSAKILLDNVAVSPVRLSRLVNIGFTSPDPVLAARVANAWGTNFIESNLARRFDATSYARKFLEDRLGQLRTRLEESERMLVAYASQQKIINLPASSAAGGSGRSERSDVSDDLQALNEELSKATAERVSAEAKFNAARSARPGAVGGALEYAAIGNLRQRKAELSAEYSKMRVQFEPQYPALVALASQISQIDAGIAREERRVNDSFRTAFAESAQRENALKGRVDALKGDLLDLRRRSIQYNIYQRDVDTNRQLYDGLLQRYKEIGVAGGVGTNNVAIVDKANVPEKPSSPRFLVNLLISLLAGLGLGAIAALALEQIDDAVADPADVERDIGLPLLGTVPKSGVEPLEAIQDRKSDLTDAYLSVQTSLEFSTSHGVPRTLSVTSTRPSEGKSVSAFALAASLARARKRVLLIDGDMRSPSVDGMLGLNREQGLSNYLSGTDDVEKLIQRSETFGFDAMTSGPLPPNAAELLTGPRFAALLTALEPHYDHVVVDSPPVMGLADAPLIGGRVEGVIFAIESRGSKTSQVRVAVERLRSAHVRILGSVLTKFDAQRAHYGSGYTYGYGYGQAEQEARQAG